MSSREDHVAAASDSRRLRGVVPTGLSEFAKGISKRVSSRLALRGGLDKKLEEESRRLKRLQAALETVREQSAALARPFHERSRRDHAFPAEATAYASPPRASTSASASASVPPPPPPPQQPGLIRGNAKTVVTEETPAPRDKLMGRVLNEISTAKLRSAEIVETPRGSKVRNRFWREIQEAREREQAGPVSHYPESSSPRLERSHDTKETDKADWSPILPKDTRRGSLLTSCYNPQSPRQPYESPASNFQDQHVIEAEPSPSHTRLSKYRVLSSHRYSPYSRRIPSHSNNSGSFRMGHAMTDPPADARSIDRDPTYTLDHSPLRVASFKENAFDAHEQGLPVAAPAIDPHRLPRSSPRRLRRRDTASPFEAARQRFHISPFIRDKMSFFSKQANASHTPPARSTTERSLHDAHSPVTRRSRTPTSTKQTNDLEVLDKIHEINERAKATLRSTRHSISTSSFGSPRTGMHTARYHPYLSPRNNTKQPFSINWDDEDKFWNTPAGPSALNDKLRRVAREEKEEKLKPRKKAKEDEEEELKRRRVLSGVMATLDKELGAAQKSVHSEDGENLQPQSSYIEEERPPEVANRNEGVYAIDGDKWLFDGKQYRVNESKS